MIVGEKSENFARVESREKEIFGDARCILEEIRTDSKRNVIAWGFVDIWETTKKEKIETFARVWARESGIPGGRNIRCLTSPGGSLCSRRRVGGFCEGKVWFPVSARAGYLSGLMRWLRSFPLGNPAHRVWWREERNSHSSSPFPRETKMKWVKKNAPCPWIPCWRRSLRFGSFSSYPGS